METTNDLISAQVQNYYRNESVDAKIKQILDDPTIKYEDKQELIATLLHPERHNVGDKEVPSQIPENLGRMLGLVGGVAAPFFMTQNAEMSPWTRGLLMGIGGLGGSFLGGQVGGIFKGPSVEYTPDGSNPASYSPFRGLLHG